MLLTKLILKNFRYHAAQTFEFKAGVTAICGINGKGKSSIIEGLQFLFTGSGYGTKEDMLKVGTVSGYVVGHFVTDDGKDIVLERSVESSKVNLRYDGQTYKKSAEVVDLWDKLFKLDKAVFNNVVIARQGEITKLFSGEASVREKIFQKIFLVPNTTQKRDKLWKSYISATPPEYAVVDQTVLDSDVQVVEQMVSMEEAEMAELNFDQETFDTLNARVGYLTRVEIDQPTRETLVAQQTEETEALQEVQAAYVEWETVAADCETYTSVVAKCNTAQAQIQKRDSIQARIDSMVDPAVERPTAKQMVALQAKLKAGEQEVYKLDTDLKTLKKKLKEYESSPTASGTCPTCGSSVEGTAHLIEHTRTEMDKIVPQLEELQPAVQQTREELTELTHHEQLWVTHAQTKNNLELSLVAFSEAVYDPAEHKEAQQKVAQLGEARSNMKQLQQQAQTLQTSLTQIASRLGKLTQYDRDDYSELPEELSTLKAQVSSMTHTRQKAEALRVSLVQKRTELKSLKKQQESNAASIVSNANRAEYLEILSELHELLHTSAFPRQLINTYASVVTEHMSSVLESLSFKYTAKVNEQFGVDIYNEDGLLLPSVSGGEEVMVGFSLRLALHNMFADAFPFMIIDEGSYGLAEEAALRYFEILRSLKGDKFKQVIVVDHNPAIANYVDHIITL